MFKCKPIFLSTLSLLIVCSHRCCGGSNEKDEILFIEDGNTDFDVLIFTQRWPVTGCMEWMEKKKENVCTLPSQHEIWIIHGVWPTRFGSIGPAFCNRSASFDINTLKPFEKELDQFWINIEKGTPRDSLWKHEWLKHGTCAAVLPSLDNENKYFGQGLVWLQQFSMSALLQKANILPDTNLTIVDIHQGIKTTLNRNPSIHCIRESKTGDTYLSEIRICFNKALELIDCDGVVTPPFQTQYNGSNIITNCHMNMTIRYPSVVPHRLIYRTEPTAAIPSSFWNLPFVNIYKLIEIIKWFTL